MSQAARLVVWLQAARLGCCSGHSHTCNRKSRLFLFDVVGSLDAPITSAIHVQLSLQGVASAAVVAFAILRDVYLCLAWKATEALQIHLATLMD